MARSPNTSVIIPEKHDNDESLENTTKSRSISFALFLVVSFLIWLFQCWFIWWYWGWFKYKRVYFVIATLLVIVYGVSIIACIVFKNHEVYILHLIVQGLLIFYFLSVQLFYLMLISMTKDLFDQIPWTMVVEDSVALLLIISLICLIVYCCRRVATLYNKQIKQNSGPALLDK